MNELDLPRGRRSPAALPDGAAALALRPVLVVAVEAAQALGPRDGDQAANVGAVELVEPDGAEHGPDVQTHRALVAAVRRGALGLLHLPYPMIEVLAHSGQPVGNGDAVGRVAAQPIE